MIKKLLLCVLLGISTSSFADDDDEEEHHSKTRIEAPLTTPKPAKAAIIRQEETLGLSDSVSSLVNKFKVNPDNISIYIRDINADQPLLLHNPQVQRTTASTMKLLTTFAALKELGPSYSWKTEAWIRGNLEDGVLDGDLIIKGYGDPFLVHERYWKFAHDLYNKGLKTINGNVIIDNSYFDIPKIDPGAFDKQPFRTYNAPPSALMFNFQATRFLFEADKENKQVKITPFPKVEALNLDNKLKLTRGSCRKQHYRPRFKRSDKGDMRITGSYATGCGQQYILRSISKPDKHAFSAFKQFWTELGGHLKGGQAEGQVDKLTDKRLHVYQSPSLGEQIRTINKWSNNVMTRQVMLTLGAEKYGTPATLDKGRNAILDVLSNAGIPQTSDILIENGSGLSRIAHVSARQMASLLEAAYHDPYMPEFMASLSLSGMDGTLYNRFKGKDMRGRFHLKTGTINDVTSIAGYMINRQGKRLIVVMLHNGKDVRRGRGVALQNAVLNWAFEQ